MKYKIIIAMLFSIYIKSQDIYINIDNEDNLNIVPYKENIITAVQNLINNKNDIDFIFNQYTKDSQEKWGEKELARTIYNSGWYKKRSILLQTYNIRCYRYYTRKKIFDKNSIYI